MNSRGISAIDVIVDEARNGRMFILIDDEDRENEGDLVMPGQMATPDAINFMARCGRGLICLAMTSSRADQLGLEPMTRTNGSAHMTAFTVSIEAREGVTTGISAADRARTVAVAIDAARGRADLVSPGHVFPLVARDGGVLVRAGHTEAAVDLSRLAGLNPSAVICEIMRDDGTMARVDDLVAFAATHGLKVGTIRDLISYRLRNERLVSRGAECTIDTAYGTDWIACVYHGVADGAEHLVLQKGALEPGQPVLVRMHRFNAFEEILEEAEGRHGTIALAMSHIEREGAGVVVVLRDARDRLSQMVQRRLDPSIEAGEDRHFRDYGVGAQILLDRGIRDLVLLTGSSGSPVAIAGFGLNVVERRALTALA